MLVKRIFDLIASSVGIIILSPAFLIVALWIVIDSPGPVFFRQSRVGRFEKEFNILKFRTMCLDAESIGTQLTVGNDRRVTKSGEILRKYKLDELPQLVNVVLGEMSLVGPRPEVPRYVAFYPEDSRKVIFSVPPGITDLASIHFRDENEILGQTDDPEKAYIEKILPVKLAYYQRYVAERSFWLDIKIIFATFSALIK